MRVLLITNLYPSVNTPWGGSFVEARAEALEAAGHSVHVLALIARRPWWMERLIARIRGSSYSEALGSAERFVPVEVPMGALQYMFARRGRYPHREVQYAAAVVARVVNLQEFDVVVAHGMYLLPAGSVARAAVGPEKYSVVCHGSDVNLLMRRRSAAYVRTFEDAKSAIFVSTALRQTARQHGLDTNVGVVIPNGVDLELFHPRRREVGRSRFGWRERTKVVAFVGNLVEIKGADRIPTIASDLYEAMPDLVMAVAGDGPLAATLARSDIGGLQMLGRLDRDGVADLMAAADVVVLPSRSEGWPSVILEAFASGTPVVGTDVGGIREALGGFGAAVESGAGVEGRLAKAALTAIRSREDAGALRKRALEYSWDATIARELSEVREQEHPC